MSEPPLPYNDKALVLLSGGMDSTICLAWALQNFKEVHTVAFDYRQLNICELDMIENILSFCASDAICLRDKFRSGVLLSHTTIDLAVLASISKSTLTCPPVNAEPVFDGGDDSVTAPTMFVPGRNILFVTFAAIVAKNKGLDNIVIGTHQPGARSPDCWEDTIRSLQVTLNLGMETHLRFVTPIMYMDKRDTWVFAERVGGSTFIDFLIEHTHTCFNGDRVTHHDWGYGCGTCSACEMRARGYEEYVGVYDS